MPFDRQRLHPAILDMRSALQQGRVTRREFLRCATLLGASAATAYALAGCSLPADPLAQMQQGQRPTPTPPPTRGGSMKIGSDVSQVLDHPARLAWLEGANQLRQVAEYLTMTDADNITHPWLLERWEVDDELKTWTLYLRDDVTFNNGDQLTADDVLFTFDQWLDPSVGSSMSGLLSYLSRTGIERVDDYTIRLHLDRPQFGVPEHLFHYPAMILHRDFAGDFLRHPIGTGPFELAEYSHGERMVLHRRRDYWRRGADGDPLPYLDDLIYLELRPEDRVAAMQGGLIDTLVMPRPADWEALRYAPGLQVLNTRTAQALVLRMRVDREPWTDVRVRNALKLCQNRAQILHVSFHDQGELAIDAHVAPVHHAYCKQPIPPYDPALSRAMLAEAGYPDGLDVTLTTKNDQGEREMARVLQELAEPGGFRIHLNIVNPTRYWTQWTDVDLGITQWFHRPLPTMLLSLAYTASEDGTLNPWNETHWVDEEFTRLLSQAERTADLEEQRALMCRLETIMQERGPIGISYWSYAWNIIRADFQNVRAHPNGYDLFYDVWKGTA